jgi:hypothetical protein
MTGLRALAVTLPLVFGAPPLAGMAADWDLVTSTGEHACAKSERVCEMAIIAVQRGWWASEWRDAVLRCEPRDPCFAERSNCIAGYNCGASQ